MFQFSRHYHHPYAQKHTHWSQPKPKVLSAAEQEKKVRLEAKLKQVRNCLVQLFC